MSVRLRAWVAVARLGLGLAAATAIGCEEDLPEVVAVGDRVRIAPLEDVPICAGSVRTFERYLAEVEDRLGIRRDGALTIYWSPQAAPQFCADENATSCGVAEARRVVARLVDAPHEFVHHVAYEAGGTSTLLLEEGIATYTAGECSRLRGRGAETLTRLEGLLPADDPTNEHYAIGGSLVAFIAEGWSFEHALELRTRVGYRDGVEVLEAATVEILGLTLDELDTLWRNSAAHDSCGPEFPRTFGEPLLHGGQRLEWGVELDCDDSRTEGPLDVSVVRADYFTREPLQRGMYQHRELIVPSAAEVELSLDGPKGSSAILYSRRCWDPEPVPTEQGIIELSPGAPQVWVLGGCVWQVFLIADDPSQVVEVSLSVEPVEP